MSGWYLMHRGWMASPDFQREAFTEPQAFIWSIEQAAFEPHLQWFNRVQYPVGRGQFVTSIRKMAEAFGWGTKRTFLFAARMERCGKWQRQETQGGKHGPTVLTVCNYEHFQSPKRAQATPGATADATARQQLGNSHATQQKEGLNNSNEGEAIKREASPSRAPARPYSEAIAIWVEFAGQKDWTPANPTLPLSDKRRKGLGKILDTYGLDGWRAGLQRAADSEWLGGPDPPAWFNFNAACNFDKFTNTFEGNYDRSFSSNRGNVPGESPWLAANAQLRGAPDRAGTTPRAIAG